MSDMFKLVFRGDIAPGHNVVDVRQRIGEMFKLDASAVTQFFSGRPVTIKKSLSATEADKWVVALKKAGIIVEVREAEPATGDSEVAPAAASEKSPAGESDPAGGAWTVEPPGADVLRAGERATVVPVEIATDHLSLDNPGADVLRPEERRVMEELDIDISHLRLEDL